MSLHQDFVDVNGIPTKVVTVGGWIDEPMASSKHVVLFITGNPGLTGYYKTFLATVHARVGLPVWVVSQAGHELPSRSADTLKANLHNYSLEGQIRHKLAFIEKYIPADVKITLIGHSIGCKIILDTLKRSSSVANRVEKCYFLFPTIERMAETPNGKFLTGIVKPFVFLIVLASWLFHVLPFFIKRFLISCWFLFDGSPTIMAGVTVNLVKPKILKNVFYLAMEEMDLVTELDHEPIEKYGDKLVFYYGTTDKWVPTDYAHKMKETFPKVEIHICEKGFDHSFVLNASTEVGRMVGEWIKDQ